MKYGGQHSCKVSVSLLSCLHSFEFLAVAPSPKPKQEPVLGPAGKRRPIIHSNSDEEDSEEEKEA